MNIKTLKSIIDNGGATIKKNGLSITYKRGWQVSKKDISVMDVNDLKSILHKINEELKKIAKDEFLGLWIDKNKIYIDLTIKINNKKQAIEFGRKNKQISIYNWYNGKCLFLEVA